MLDLIRKLKRSIVGAGLVGICILLMMQFGVGGSLRKGGAMSAHSVAATVDGHEISFETFYQRRQLIESNMRARLGKNFDQFRSFIRLDEQAADSLVNDYLFSRFTDALGLTISTQQVEDEIREDPFFGGEFTKQKFQTYLAAYGVTGAALERMKQQQLIQRQVQGTFRDLQYVTDAELRSLFTQKNTKAGFQYAVVDAKNFIDKVDVSDEKALEDYFTANREHYKKPRAVRYAFVTFDPAAYQSQVELSDEDVQLAYESRQGDFREPKRFRLSHIVLKKEKDADKEKKAADELEKLVTGDKKKEEKSEQSEITPNQQKKSLADSIAKQLEDGKDFAELAKQSSEDAETKDKGGEWGWKTYGDVGPKVAQAISSLTAGETSSVIETDTDFQIVRIDEVVESHVKPFEEVKSVVAADLRGAQAPVYARADADQFLSGLQEARSSGAKSLAEVAHEKNKTIVDTGRVLTATETPSGAPAGLTEKLVNRSQGDVDIIELGDKDYVVDVMEIREASDPEFTEVKDAVINDYKRDQSLVLAKKAAEELRADLIERKSSLADAAKSKNFEVKTIEPTTVDGENSELFTNVDLKQKAFALSKESPVLDDVVTAGTRFFVAELTSKTPPDDKQFDEKKLELRAQEEQAAAGRIGEALVARLRSEAEIWVNPSITEKPEES